MSSSSAAVFLANCDPDHFDRTVATGVSPGDVPAIEGDEDPIRVWALEGGDQNEENFERLDPGHLVLFYAGDAYVGTGVVDETLEAAGEWTSELFGGEERAVAFTVRDFAAVNVPRAIVNGLFGYSDTWVPSSFFRVADSRVENDPAAIKLAIEEYDERYD